MNAIIRKIFLAGFPLTFLVFPKVTFGLESNQLRVIQKAAQCQYKVDWLNHSDTSQDVILIGETHVVNKTRYEIAKQLMSEFPLIGIEGARTIALPARITSLGKSKDSSLALKVGSFPGPIKLARQKIGGLHYESLREIVAWYRDQDQGFKRALQRGFPILEERSLLIVPGLTQETMVTEETIDAIMQKVESFLSQTGVVELEFFEPIPTSLANLALAQDWASEELIEKSCADRDTIMTRTILSTLKNRPDDRTMLVLVGEHHVDGIASNLIASGFIKTTMPQPQHSYCNVM